MGTRGLYSYKWRGRYYVYYNHYDSYPSGLGEFLSGEVPTDPDAYKKWLEHTRSLYQKLEKELDQKHFTVTIDQIMKKETQIFDGGLHDMESIPLFVAPCNNLFIEYVYIFDLDDERFSCNKCCYFKLDKLTQDWVGIDSESLFFGDELKEGETMDPSATTPASQRAPLSYDPAPEYSKLNTTTISPKSLDAIPDKYMRKPAIHTSLALFNAFLKKHKTGLCEARDQHHENDFLFREISFALLSIASCSGDIVRWISAQNFITEEKWDYAVLRDINNTEKLEFVSKFAHGYHLEGQQPGCAPKANSYWMQNVLVCLKRDVDITSVAGFKDAILSAVKKGKEDGKTLFDAVVFSMKHFILIRVVNDQVQHTKCVSFVRKLNEVFNRNDPTKRVIAVPKPEAYDLVDDEISQEHAFYILAMLFEGVQLRELRPSSAHSHGIFPNEVYENIIKCINDAPTRTACLKVSRAFRDYASQVLHVGENERLEYCRGKDPECISPSTGALLKIDGPAWRASGNWVERSLDSKLYVAVVGYADGSAFYDPDMGVSFRVPECE